MTQCCQLPKLESCYYELLPGLADGNAAAEVKIVVVVVAVVV